MSERHIEASAIGIQHEEHPKEKAARLEAKRRRKKSWLSAGWWTACGKFIAADAHAPHPRWIRDGKLERTVGHDKLPLCDRCFVLFEARRMELAVRQALP